MLDTSDNAILSKFPMETPRDGQVEAIKFALDNFNKGKKFVIIEAPTGAGKSAIALGVAKHFDTSYYLTIQKILQDQLSSEFGIAGRLGNMLVDLKGRGAYECPFYKHSADKAVKLKIIKETTAEQWRTRRYTCAEGHCRTKGLNKYKECVDKGFCPYYRQIDLAMASPICLMNFSSFLYQTQFTDRFGNRSLLIIDEAHNTESQLLNFISITISDADFPGLKLPNLETAEEYAIWMIEQQLQVRIATEIQQAEYANDYKRMDDLLNTQTRITWFIAAMGGDDHDAWVCEYTTTPATNKVILKPVYIKKHAQEYLFQKADYVLMLSATILDVDVMARSLGIEKDRIAAKRLASRFPVENRPIYFKPAARMTGGQSKMHEWGPKLAAAVEEIVKMYPEDRGIIHTHNFAIARMLMGENEVAHRFLFQENFQDKSEMLAVHARTPRSIIVAPAMHEGLDLRGDLSRFQIICKMPFANFFEDKQLAARKDADPQYYAWVTALKLVQSVGRSVRSETDWAHTYIIDKTFAWWYRDNKKILPTWFKESLDMGTST